VCLPRAERAGLTNGIDTGHHPSVLQHPTGITICTTRGQIYSRVHDPKNANEFSAP
jgi:hypothetical protein